MDKPAIYDQHDRAFASVSAWVICHKGERVATVAMKFPRDGASRQYAYLHWIGVPMVRGWASGGGYDKGSAAVAGAAGRMPALDGDRYAGGTPHHSAEEKQLQQAFRAALAKDSGKHWYDELRDAGFDVWQAV